MMLAYLHAKLPSDAEAAELESNPGGRWGIWVRNSYNDLAETFAVDFNDSAD